MDQLEKIYKDEYTKPLLKMITAQDKALAAKEREITFLGESHRKREEDLKSEVEKAMLELDICKRQLEKAKKKPEEVRTELFGKVQKGHDKVRELEKDLKAKDEKVSVLVLDNEATTKDLEDGKAKVGRQKEQLKQFREEYTKLEEGRDQLRPLQLSQSPNFEAQARTNKKVADEARARVVKLEKDITKAQR